VIAWTCVVDDGTRPWGPGIPIEQRRPLHLTLGESGDVQVSLINPVGGVVALDPGDFLQLTGRTLCAPTRQLFSYRSTPSTNHRHSIAIPMTAAMTPQRGTFDLWLVRGPERIQLIPLSELTIVGSAIGNNYQ
jgi:hypothetical protein